MYDLKIDSKKDLQFTQKYNSNDPITEINVILIYFFLELNSAPVKHHL